MTSEEVLRQHLQRVSSGSEEDFLRSYREDSFIIMGGRVHRGLEEIRACFRQLKEDLPGAEYDYRTLVVEADIGFLEWSAESDAGRVAEGVDSYLIGDGCLRAQTIHYTVLPNGPAGKRR